MSLDMQGCKKAENPSPVHEDLAVLIDRDNEYADNLHIRHILSYRG
jgi:hypothetical protein